MQKLGNTSSAVMQQRAKPRNDGLDDFPTPPWAVRAFLAHILGPLAAERGESLADLRAWEPACNRGFMARPLAERFGSVFASDARDYGAFHNATHDFLQPYLPENLDGPPDWIITNPPFRLASDFARRCMDIRPKRGFALLVRVAFLEGAERYETLFRRTPPSIIAQYAERVPMVEGRYDPKASTATAYAWLVWETDRIAHVGVDAPRFGWIPPCKPKFYRPEDADWMRETADVR